MSEQSNPFGPEVLHEDLGRERRVWIRYPGNLDTFCQPSSAETATGPETSWPASVWDVSLGGMGLLVERRFEPGSTLMLLTAVNGLPRILQMEVVHVSAHASGQWLLGCTFARPLSEEELQAVWQDG
jgi:hypothetical protein